MKMKKFLALALCAALTLSAGCGSTSEPTGNEGGEGSATASESAEGSEGTKSITIGMPASYVQLDPIAANEGMSIMLMGNVFSRLYEVDANGQPQLDLAESVDISSDGKTYTFKLREAKWSNGEPLTADDFVFAWRRLATPSNAAEFSFMVGEAGIKNGREILAGEMEPSELGVSAPDASTFVVELENPIPFFPSIVAFSAFSPLNEAFVTEQGENFAVNIDNVIYCGPYLISEYEMGSNSITMAKNPNYYEADSVDIDEVTFQIVPDPQQAVMSYENGELDLVRLSGDMVSQYADREDYMSMLGPYNWYMYFNLDKMENQAMRQAIGYAVNRDALVDNVLKNGSIPQYNMLMTGLSQDSSGKDFNEYCPDHYQTDKEKAKELWAQAQTETDQRTVVLTYEEDSEFVGNAAAYVQSEIESTLEGLTVELQRIPKKARIENMQNGDYDFALHRWSPDYTDPTCIMALYTSDSVFNWANFNSPEYDKLIEEAGTTLAMDTEARWNALVEAEAIFMDGAASVPLFQLGDAILLNPVIKGYNMHFTGVETYWRHVTME